ncbi:DUF3558 family protein [Streptomyces sp. 142MFCol3.1]|uniref:DUF3558 family protein n=1 Tax=Streptomyces sp. 142MFCol3.1 TaxID=1172179 RepID=UPI0007C587BA|nr:DUF3558 family protein [Streptomyces sp. 142MFCol3.1]
MRRVVMTATVLACVLGLAACGGSDGDKGSGGPGSGAGGSSAAQGGGADKGKTGTPLADVDPCTLLKPADVPQLSQDDYTQPTMLAVPGKPTCSGYDFAVEINDGGADVHDMEFHGSRAEALPDIAGHKAVMTETKTGAARDCAVSLDVTTEEYVRVTVTAGDSPAQTCDIAKKAAEVVAGRLSS